jgi:hypothetical protein
MLVEYFCELSKRHRLTQRRGVFPRSLDQSTTSGWQRIERIDREIVIRERL